MIGLGYAIFETAVGLCAVAWGEDGLIGVQLPEGDRAAAEARLRRRFHLLLMLKAHIKLPSLIGQFHHLP